METEEQRMARLKMAGEFVPSYYGYSKIQEMIDLLSEIDDEISHLDEREKISTVTGKIRKIKS